MVGDVAPSAPIAPSAPKPAAKSEPAQPVAKSAKPAKKVEKAKKPKQSKKPKKARPAKKTKSEKAKKPKRSGDRGRPEPDKKAESAQPVQAAVSAAGREAARQSQIETLIPAVPGVEAKPPRKLPDFKPPLPSQTPTQRLTPRYELRAEDLIEEEIEGFDTGSALAQLIAKQGEKVEGAKPVEKRGPTEQADDSLTSLLAYQVVPKQPEVKPRDVPDVELASISQANKILLEGAAAQAVMIDAAASGSRRLGTGAVPAVRSRGSNMMLWLAAGAVALTAAVLLWATRDKPEPEVVAAESSSEEPEAPPAERDAAPAAIAGDEEPEPQDEPEAKADGGQEEAKRDPDPEAEQEDPRIAKAEAAPDPTLDPQPEGEGVDEGAVEPEAQLEPAGDADEPSPAPDPASDDVAEPEPGSDADSVQLALAELALTACANDNGIKAREAYRKLRGRQLRSRVLTACRKQSVDVNYTGTGASPGELLREAERALEAGDPKTAFTTARTSNRMRRNRAALLVMGLASCDLKDAKQATSLKKHLGEADRALLAQRCAKVGIEP